MPSIQAIDTYTLACEKSLWSPQDRYIASCLDIKEEDGVHLIDLRIVSKRALNYYLESTFPYIMKSPQNAGYRTSLFHQIKQMYNHVFNDFMVNYYPKAGYKNKIGKDLYDHQKEVLAQSIYRPVNLWALEMGTGKTLAAATMSKITSAKRTVIICPSLVKWNWYSDMTRYWGFNPMFWTILDAKKSKSMFAFRERFVVLNYKQVRKKMDYLLRDRIDHIIIDEAHYLKNHLSGRSKAAADLISLAERPRLTMLTGTPVTNRINDMFNYLKMAQHPLGDNLTAFKKRYAITTGTRGGKVTGAKNISELKGRISNLMIRLRSEDCLDLPDIIVKNYYFETDDISDEYDKEIEALRDHKKQYDKLHGKEKSQMGHKMKGNIHTLNRIVTTAKVPMIKQLIDHLMDMGEKVVVFAGYTAPLDLLEDVYGDKCVKITGKVVSHTRQQLIDRFIENDNCKVFLGNMQAAGIGINLVNAAHVIFMNFPFTPDQIEQARKRLHRSGQTRKVHVYQTIAKETIDEHIYDLIADKSDDINALVDGDHHAVTNYRNLLSDLFVRLLEK